MNAYKTVELGSACELVMGQSPSSDTYNSDGIGLPFFQGNADFGEEHPTPSTWCSEPKKTARKGDILISVRAPIGAVNTATEECCIGRGVAALRPDKNLLNAAFLKYHLIAKRPELERAGTGSTFTAVGKKALSKLEVRLFSLGDQIEMSRRLDILSENIHTAREQLTMLDYLVKSRFTEMFGDPCNPKDGKGRSKLDSFCELRIGPFGSVLHKEDYITGGHPLVNPSHIVRGTVRPDNALTISEEKYKSLAAYHLRPGDVVLGRRGEIGRCAVVDKNGMICGTGSMIIRPGQKVRSGYLQRVVSFPSFSHALESNAVGVTMKNLNAKIVGSTEVYLPKLAEQDAFIDFASQIDKLRFDVQRQIEKLEVLKKSLMQEYFG